MRLAGLDDDGTDGRGHDTHSVKIDDDGCDSRDVAVDGRKLERRDMIAQLDRVEADIHGALTSVDRVC